MIIISGKRPDALKRKFKEVSEDIRLQQPAIVVLDDLHLLAEHISDVQKETSGEGGANTKAAQGTNNYEQVR